MAVKNTGFGVEYLRRLSIWEFMDLLENVIKNLKDAESKQKRT
jgi:hypothetical protein